MLSRPADLPNDSLVVRRFIYHLQKQHARQGHRGANEQCIYISPVNRPHWLGDLGKSPSQLAFVIRCVNDIINNSGWLISAIEPGSTAYGYRRLNVYMEYSNSRDKGSA